MAQQERERRARQGEHDPVIVYPFRDWCRIRGVSPSTGRRIIASGRVQVTWLSERRFGIRSDHDREFLDASLPGGAGR